MNRSFSLISSTYTTWIWVATGIRIIVNHAEILRVEILMGGGKSKDNGAYDQDTENQNIEYMIKATRKISRSRHSLEDKSYEDNNKENSSTFEDKSARGR